MKYEGSNFEKLFLGANFEKLRMKYESLSMRMDKTLKKSIYSAK
jgi:hypothetical protein